MTVAGSLVASMVDEHTRESFHDIVDWSITGEHLVHAIDQLIAARGAPTVIRCDNGPDLLSETLQAFCADRIGIGYIPPGTPWNNAFIESFNNRVRGECLNWNQ